MARKLSPNYAISPSGCVGSVSFVFVSIYHRLVPYFYPKPDHKVPARLAISSTAFPRSIGDGSDSTAARSRQFQGKKKRKQTSDLLFFKGDTIAKGPSSSSLPLTFTKWTRKAIKRAGVRRGSLGRCEQNEHSHQIRRQGLTFLMRKELKPRPMGMSLRNAVGHPSRCSNGSRMPIPHSELGQSCLPKEDTMKKGQKRLKTERKRWKTMLNGDHKSTYCQR
ncbi:hypothetical protein M9H77_12801 [Catharanthus roseus]|uniref:Uncharacterized protein n=1 Tax=Catharanthus roseus TaxID=4058 RepID=A0ACC0BII0_CATRO|nr:hypothetical protein M9H77_12801 [Catharanthus roseus]